MTGAEEPDLFAEAVKADSRCLACGGMHLYTGFIYRTKNTHTGQWYVGSHMGCEHDGYLGSGVKLKKAITAFGEEAFEREVLLRIACGRTYLLECEERLLIRLNASADPLSYNSKNRGLGQDPEVTSAIWSGRKRSPEQFEKARETVKASGVLAGANNPRAKPVVNLATHEIFPYARLAAESVGGSDPGIHQALKNGFAHKGHYWMWLDEWEEVGRPAIHPRLLESPRAKGVTVRLTDGVIFVTQSAAARAHGVTSSRIAAAVRAPAQESSAGHYWMRYEDWLEAGEPLVTFEPYKRAIDRVVRLSDGDLQENAEAAAPAWGISAVSIHKHCRGDFRAQDYMYFGEWEAAGYPTRKRRKAHGEPKAVYCPATGERYASISAAARIIGRPVSQVSLAIHRRRSVAGRLFRFVDPRDYLRLRPRDLPDETDA